MRSRLAWNRQPVTESVTIREAPVDTTPSVQRVADASRHSAYDDLLWPGRVDETAGIAVSREQNAVLLTDDLAARDRATGQGIEVHGSIGIVELGYASGRLDRDEAASRMRRLQSESSLFVSEAVVERGIEMLDEE